MRNIITALLITLATKVVGETAFEFDNDKYRINLFNLYCPPEERSLYDKLNIRETEYAKSKGLPFSRVNQIWCNGPTQTGKDNNVLSRVSVHLAQNLCLTSN